jgi:hypothetical protein
VSHVPRIVELDQMIKTTGICSNLGQSKRRFAGMLGMCSLKIKAKLPIPFMGAKENLGPARELWSSILCLVRVAGESFLGVRHKNNCDTQAKKYHELLSTLGSV